MKALRHLFVAALCLLSLSGCLQIEKIVKLKADGSGTIEETLAMSKETAASLQKMAEGWGQTAGKTPGQTPSKNAGKKKKSGPKPFELLDESKLRAEAETMGEGVKFVSAAKIDTDKSKGYTAIFSFTDINKVKLDQNPGSAIPTPGAGAGGPGQSKKEPLAFRFEKGEPAALTILMPQPETKTAPKKQTDDVQDMAMQAMRQIFKDMKVTIAVEVQGAIKETNAEYHEGSRVTLLEMDFNKLLADPEKFKALAHDNPQTLQESKALLKGIDGVKIESASEVTVKFQ